MYRLAESLGLVGFVRNDREGVWLEIEGPTATLDRFAGEMRRAAPAASRIDAVEQAVIPLRREHGFGITESPSDSARSHASAEIPVDLGPCADCLCELEDPANRRYRYPFINC